MGYWDKLHQHSQMYLAFQRLIWKQYNSCVSPEMIMFLLARGMNTQIANEVYDLSREKWHKNPSFFIFTSNLDKKFVV